MGFRKKRMPSGVDDVPITCAYLPRAAPHSERRIQQCATLEYVPLTSSVRAGLPRWSSIPTSALPKARAQLSAAPQTKSARHPHPFRRPQPSPSSLTIARILFPRRGAPSMLNAARQLFSSLSLSGERAPPCATCSDPEVLARCQAARAGSVKPYTAQLLVRLPPPASQEAGAPPGSWWPRSVEAVETLGDLAAALKKATKGTGQSVSLLACETASGEPPLFAESSQIRLFPGPGGAREVPLDQLRHHIMGILGLDDSPATSAPASPPTHGSSAAAGLSLLVCTHARRDDRCGILGNKLADALDDLVAGQGLAGAQVLRISHIGGHVHAGNVIVYWDGRSVNGDWFGFVAAENAREFLEAVLEAAQPCEGLPRGAGALAHAFLREHWRGCLGLTKDEQVDVFLKAGGILPPAADIEDLAAKA